jgi:hypothetical protein
VTGVTLYCDRRHALIGNFCFEVSLRRRAWPSYPSCQPQVAVHLSTIPAPGTFCFWKDEKCSDRYRRFNHLGRSLQLSSWNMPRLTWLLDLSYAVRSFHSGSR